MCRLFVVIAILLSLWSCDRSETNTPPEIIFNVFPYVGDSLTPFHLDLTKSSDHEDLVENLMYRFDWNSDGAWDTDFQKMAPVIHLFRGGGMHYVTAEIVDRDGLTCIKTDSLYIFPNPIIGEMMDPRDDQKYKTVYLMDRWWMAEHLRYGTKIISGNLPEDNGIAEYYLLNDEDENLPKYGGLYTWDEAMAYTQNESNTGICPPGWHLPTMEEWESISKDIPRIFLSYYHGPDGPSGMNFLLGGSLLIYQEKGEKIIENIFNPEEYAVFFWSSGQDEKIINTYDGFSITQKYHYGFYLNPTEHNSGDPLSTGFQSSADIIHVRGDMEYYIKHDAFAYHVSAKSIRCIKDI